MHVVMHFFMHVWCVNSIKYEYVYLKWYRYHSRAWVRFLIYPVVTMALACIVSEIKRDVGQKSRFLYTCIRRLRWGSLSEYYHGLPLGLEKIEWCELKSGRIVSESQSSQTMAVASSGDVVNWRDSDEQTAHSCEFKGHEVTESRRLTGRLFIVPEIGSLTLSAGQRKAVSANRRQLWLAGRVSTLTIQKTSRIMRGPLGTLWCLTLISRLGWLGIYCRGRPLITADGRKGKLVAKQKRGRVHWSHV